MRQQVMHSLRWTLFGRFSVQVLSWVSTLIVIRLLSPGDYGLVAMATMVIGFSALFSELGMGAVLIQQENIDDLLIRRVFGIGLIINFLLFLILTSFAPAIADFFDEKRLSNVIQVQSLSFLISAFGIVPSSLLTRNMEFRKKAFANITNGLTASLLTLCLALADMGFWALVLGSLGGGVVYTIVQVIALGRWYWPCFSLRGTRQLVSFGGIVSLFRTLWYLYSQADIFIIGKLLGKEMLGIYSVAMDIATLPMQKVAGIFNEVGFAAYSKGQREEGDISSYFLTSARYLSMVGFPIFWGISSIASEITQVILGATWVNAEIPIKLLSLVVPLRMLSNVTTPALMGIGMLWPIVQNTLVGCIIMPLALLAGAPWGINGVATAWIIAYPIFFLLTITRALPFIKLRISDYLMVLTKPAIASMAMYLIVELARLGPIKFLSGTVWGLVALVILGASVYVVFMWTFDRTACMNFLKLVRGN